MCWVGCGTLLPNRKQCPVDCQRAQLSGADRPISVIHVTHLTTTYNPHCHWALLSQWGKVNPLYMAVPCWGHIRCFHKSKQMTLLRKLTLDNLVGGVLPATFHSLPGLPRIAYNFIWSYSISTNTKIYDHHYWSILKQKKKDLNMPVNPHYKKREVVVFVWKGGRKGSLILKEGRLQTRNL